MAPMATVARWRHGDAVIDVPASDTVRLAVSLRDGQRVRDQAGPKLVVDEVRVGSVSLFPASEHSRLAVEGRADVLQIFVRENWLETMIDHHFVCPTLFDSHDTEFQAAAMQVLVAAARGEPDDVLLLEAGLQRLVSRLLHYQEQDSCRTRLAQGGLSPSALRRVDEMITATLYGPSCRTPTLAELAATAGLSVSHFLRAFHRQTGETPHRHLLRRRLERGISLLRSRRASVAEVADETGFATPAHFVATFRRTMGVTPGALRNALAG